MPGRRRLRRPLAGLALAAVLIAAASGGGAAPEPRSLLRIGVLNEAWSATHPTVEGLKAGLRALGLEEGRRVTFDVRFTEGRPEATAAVATALMKTGVDLLVTSQEAATLAAREATRTVPIVFTAVGDPVGAGIIDSIARPGGNVTGVSSLETELVGKRLQVLKTLAPSVRRVWLVYYGADLSTTPMIARALDAARHLRVELVPRGVLQAHQLTRLLQEVRFGDGVLAPVSSSLDLPAAILERSLAQRIPVVFPTALWVGHGGLVSYGPDSYAEGVQAASLVAKILGGARPQDLPVQGADRIELAVNLKTAELLGLAVPRRILLRADAFRR